MRVLYAARNAPRIPTAFAAPRGAANARRQWPQVCNLRCLTTRSQEAQSRQRWGSWVPRREGLPTPRRRTFAAGILPFAHSAFPPLRHPCCAEETHAGSRNTGSPSLTVVVVRVLTGDVWEGNGHGLAAMWRVSRGWRRRRRHRQRRCGYSPARGPPTDWGEVVQVHDDRDSPTEERRRKCLWRGYPSSRPSRFSRVMRAASAGRSRKGPTSSTRAFTSTMSSRALTSSSQRPESMESAPCV